MNHTETLGLVRDAGPAASIIAMQALDRIAAEYSETGDPMQDARAELYLPYHNTRHTRFVMIDIRLLRDVVSLNPHEYDITLAAASAHDVYHDLGTEPGDSERLSAGWLADRMAEHPDTFSRIDIDYGRLAVHGTITALTKLPFAIRQLATEQSYPSRRAELIAHAVASADMGRLWTPDGPLNTHLLYQEAITGGLGIAPNLRGLISFQEKQMDLLDSGYRYPDREMARALATHRREVSSYHNSLLQDLEQGNVESWQQIIERDKSFRQEHA